MKRYVDTPPARFTDIVPAFRSRPEVTEHLRRIAAEEERSVASVARQAIEQFVDEHVSKTRPSEELIKT